MKDYSAMSDSEINNYVYLAKEIGHPMDENEVKAMQLYFNPCNNPADAWPIIIENKINIRFGAEGFHHEAQFLQYGRESVEAYHKNPLRAAMIVYLQMMEGK